MKKLDKLLKYQKRINDLEYTINLLNWELNTSTPIKAEDDLISLITVYEDMLFSLKTANEYKKLLESVIKSKNFGTMPEAEQRYIKIKLKRLKEDKKVPRKFYCDYINLKNKTNMLWKKALEKNDYQIYKPYLKKIIAMTKKYYNYLEPKAKNIYDVMLDHYEAGINSQVIDKWFDEIKKAIIPLVFQEKSSLTPYIKDLNEYELRECANYLLNYIGFDLTRGIIGKSPHAFTEKINNNDIRITFKKTNKPIDFCSTIIHEGGHGIFEQNVDDIFNKYGNSSIEGLNALHESQSRFYENILGRNINFWLPIYDDVKKLLKIDLNLEDFIKALNTPNPSLIRTEADELTYCMHIIVRYEIERDLFNGLIKVDDLPKVWKKKMKDYLGVDVKNDNEGLMQDIHWAEGEFGYFPTYLIGNIYDGMFITLIEKELGSIDDLLKQGKIKVITNFLIEKVYKDGIAYSSFELIEKLCGEKISTKPLIQYFNCKYKK